MKVVFLSNKITPHQVPFCQEMYRYTQGEFFFIETLNECEFIPIGWRADGSKYSFVVSSKEFNLNKNKWMRIINEADVVLIGSAPNEFVKSRIKKEKTIFRYAERPLKKGNELIKFIPRWFKWRKIGIDRKNIYMLCASAYTCADYAKFGLFKNKCYKWGYFPETIKYENINNIIESKQKNSILWVARMIDWKHPELAIEVAKRLKADGYDFNMNIIGTGVLEDEINRSISDADLTDCVHMLGSMTPDEVRRYMEQSEIFLFTSDRNEGWGAVLNESMNSACAVVASHAIGSTPFLIKDTENGLIYKDGDIDDLYSKTKWLLDNPEMRKTISEKAYYTIANEWNAENATRNLVILMEKVLSGENNPYICDKGVCSKAEILKDDWYR